MQENHEIQSDSENVSLDDVKNSWNDDLNLQEENISNDNQESVDGLETEQTSNEGNEESVDEPVNAIPTPNKEPIVLRKQKKQLLEKNKRLEDELYHLKQQVYQNRPSEPEISNDLTDPVTGQAIDEDSVQGQVLKALNGIAYKHKKDELLRQQKQQQQQQQNEYFAAIEELKDKLALASEKYEDFDEVVLADSVSITDSMRDIAALMLPNPEDVLYLIAKDPNELHRIGQLPARQQAREMVKISGSLLNRGQDRKPATPARTIRPITNNPVKQPAREITDKSSVLDIRRRLKNNWK